MMELAFNEAGYYVRGVTHESSMAVTPRTDPEGNLVFHSLEQQYAVLIRALTEISGHEVSEDIIVYNDTRIIEELSGIADPMFPEMTNHVRRNIIPEIKGCVWFHKKSPAFVQGRVQEGIDGLVNTLDAGTRTKQALESERRSLRATDEKKRIRVHRLKRGWLHPQGSPNPISDTDGVSDNK